MSDDGDTTRTLSSATASDHELDAVVGLLDELGDQMARWEPGPLAGESPEAEENRTIRGAEASLARQRSRAFRETLAELRERTVAMRTELQGGVHSGRLSAAEPAVDPAVEPAVDPAAADALSDRYGSRLAAALERSAKALVRPETADDALGLIVEGACASVPHAHRAGVSLFAKGGIVAKAPTDDVVRALDEAQAELSEGPCWDSARTQDRVLVHDLHDADDRWPRFAEVAREHGVRSLVAFPLFGARGPAGALNLYGDIVGAFGAEDLDIGGLFASQASVALRGAQRMDGLNSALTSRDVIGQAKGILIERFSLDPDAAFTMLVKSSQDVNLKLTEVARWVVSEKTGVPPDQL